MDTEWTLGMDPGKHGGLVLVDNADMQHQVHLPTPVKDGRVDVKAIAEWLLPYAGQVKSAFIEDVHSLLGSSSKGSFEFGHAAGSLYGAVQAILPVQVGYVAPAMWQRTAWKHTGKVNGTPKLDKDGNQKVLKSGELAWNNDPKASSLQAAKYLFPDVNFVPKRCRKEHDGLIDAALIAYAVMPDNIADTIRYIVKKKKKLPKGAVVLEAPEDNPELYIGPGKERKRLAKARGRKKK